jgi:C_GCAxxG_C_C family probable redox protein
MSRAERAKEYFKAGYNCSQAVALAFADLMDLDEKTIAKITQPFGGGMGRLRLTCGAVSGMATVVGAIFGDAELTADGKKNTYSIVQEVCGAFKNECGSLICGELLTGANLQVEVGGEAEKRTNEYYKKRPCAELVYTAARILEEFLEKKNI